MKTITTISGDTWDTLALRAYGDELLCQFLMEERLNTLLLDVEVFSGGMTVYVPDVDTTSVMADVPAWRKT